jgi:MarR family transcriptional regulator, repressor for mepA
MIKNLQGLWAGISLLGLLLTIGSELNILLRTRSNKGRIELSIPNSFEIQRLLRRVGMGIKAFQDSHLLPYGLTNQQGRLVGFLLEREDAGVLLCQRDVEAELGVTGPSITSLLQGLERKGFILRRTKATDARSKELFVTEKGRALVEEFKKVFLDTEEIVSRGFSQEERSVFVALLKRTAQNLE